MFSLLENLVETSTIRDCSGVFTWLEEHADALGGGRARAAGQYNMLRMCNQLLRRLSKGHDAVLCGCVAIPPPLSPPGGTMPPSPSPHTLAHPSTPPSLTVTHTRMHVCTGRRVSGSQHNLVHAG